MTEVHTIIKKIKSNTKDYEQFEEIIFDSLRRYQEPRPTITEIENAIDEYIWDLYTRLGIQWLSAWDERHRENIATYIESID